MFHYGQIQKFNRKVKKMCTFATDNAGPGTSKIV